MVTSEFIPTISLPFGGSVTLFSMLFVVMIGYWYGDRKAKTYLPSTPAM